MTPDQLVAKERLLDEVVGDDVDENERKEIRERFTVLVDTVLSWSTTKETDIKDVERLGGGFKNPVLMITTARGEQFVAKGFAEEDGLTSSIMAKTELERITGEDESLIPRSEIFNDTLFSEKAKGVPVRSLIEGAVRDPENIPSAESALFAVGSTLGFLHERTERAIEGVDDLDEEIVDQVLEDREKIHKHMGQLKVDELLGFNEEDMQHIGAEIDEYTEPKFVSLVHGDPHLDNFFHEEGGASVEIVDYDDIREGDPMADLGRSLQSLSDWCHKYNTGRDLEFDLTRSLVRGYESKRKESDLIYGDREMDPIRVVVYGLRLELVQLKSYTDLRSRLSVLGSEMGLTERQVIEASEAQEPLIEQRLNPDEISSLNSLRKLTGDLKDALSYLKSINEDRVDQGLSNAA